MPTVLHPGGPYDKGELSIERMLSSLVSFTISSTF